MEYRLATVVDWPAISEYVHGRDYFMPIDPATLGGHWLIAVDAAGVLHGTIWFFGEVPHAYVDYWAGSHIIAARLGAILEKMLRANGVRSVRGVIKQNNDSAVRLADALGMFTRSGDYLLVHRSI